MVKRQQQRQRGYETAEASPCYIMGAKNVFLLGIYSLMVYQLGTTLSYGSDLPLRRLEFIDDLVEKINVTATALVQETAAAYFQEMDPTRTSPSAEGELVIDILQIGSNQREHLMVAQQKSFGSHVSVRHVFNATEDDDDDKLCNAEVSNEDAYEICKFCRGQPWDPESHKFMRYMRKSFARPQWLEKKVNPSGWLCAQRRPLHGLYKVLQMYRNHGIELPDHLILMDDDTYYNMEQFQKLYVDETPELPLVRAGCLVRAPLHLLNFTFPFGGYGVVFNRPSLQVLMKPIHCPRDAETCARIQESQIGEHAVFRDGMTLIDLIQAYASHEPYRNFRKGKWSTGWCLHSDWAVGYFLNFYSVSRHSSFDKMANVANDRLQEWLESGIYSEALGMCRNNAVNTCQPDSLLCHYMTAAAMVNHTRVVRQRLPDRFKDATSTSQA